MRRTGDMRNSGTEPWWVSFSRVKSVAEAGAAADIQWCSRGPGYSCPSVLPSLEQVGFCPHVLQPWNDHRNLRLHVQVPGRKQEEHREGWSFCLVLGPKDALLFHTDSKFWPHCLHSVCRYYVIWPHWAARASSKVFSAQHTVTVNKKYGTLSERKKWEWIFKRQIAESPTSGKFKDRNAFLNFFMLLFQKTDWCQEKDRSKSIKPYE